jgi:hypothetical protein
MPQSNTVALPAPRTSIRRLSLVAALIVAVALLTLALVRAGDDNPPYDAAQQVTPSLTGSPGAQVAQPDRAKVAAIEALRDRQAVERKWEAFDQAVRSQTPGQRSAESYHHRR